MVYLGPSASPSATPTTSPSRAISIAAAISTMSDEEYADEYENDYENDFDDDDEDEEASSDTSDVEAKQLEGPPPEDNPFEGAGDERADDEGSTVESAAEDSFDNEDEESSSDSEGSTVESAAEEKEKESDSDAPLKPLNWPLNDFASVPPLAGENNDKEQFSPPAHSNCSTNEPQHGSLDASPSSSVVQEDRNESTPSPSPTALSEGASSSHIISALSKVPSSEILHVPTTDKALRHKFIEASTNLVTQAERNLSLGLQLEQQSEELSRIQAEVDAFSNTLLQGISGGITDVENYRHVPLAELLRLRLQQESNENSDPSAAAATVSSPPKSAVAGIQNLERQLVTEKKRNKTLERRIAELQSKLDDAGKGKGTGAVEDIDTLKAKISKLSNCNRTERELRSRSEKEVKMSHEKIEALSDHVEKLMLHLKQEAAGKARALKELSLANREVELLQSRTAAMSKRNARKDQVILDLKEEEAALEKQLAKMQEKYNELRLKVDWTRTQTTISLKKKNEEIQHLQSKLAR